MASGETHARVNLCHGVLLVAGSHWWLANTWEVTAGVALGSFLGIIITPDLDIAHLLTHEKKRAYKLGWGIGLFWQSYWYLYGTVMGHRSVSHWPLIGTLTRLLYLGLPWFLVAYGLGWKPTIPQPYQEFFLATLVAWCLQDAMHLLLDIIWTMLHINRWESFWRTTTKRYHY